MLTQRMVNIVVPANDTTVVALQTGIGVPAGHAVCFVVTSAPLEVNGRGFLFTPAPAS